MKHHISNIFFGVLMFLPYYYNYRTQETYIFSSVKICVKKNYNTWYLNLVFQKNIYNFDVSYSLTIWDESKPDVSIDICVPKKYVLNMFGSKFDIPKKLLSDILMILFVTVVMFPSLYCDLGIQVSWMEIFLFFFKNVTYEHLSFQIQIFWNNHP